MKTHILSKLLELEALIRRDEPMENDQFKDWAAIFHGEDLASWTQDRNPMVGTLLWKLFVARQIVGFCEMELRKLKR